MTAYGEPVGYRNKPDTYRFGYPFRWKDLTQRRPWLHLAEATTAQLRYNFYLELAADNRLIFYATLQALIAPTFDLTDRDGVPALGPYNGDSMIPPEVLGQSFGPTYNHTFSTGGTGSAGACSTAAILNLPCGTITDHPHGTTPASRLIVFAHPQEAATIRTFRVDVNLPLDLIPGIAVRPQCRQARSHQVDPAELTTCSRRSGLYRPGRSSRSWGSFRVVARAVLHFVGSPMWDALATWRLD